MDYGLFKFINDLAGRSHLLDWFGIFCAEYLIFIMGISSVAILFFYKKEKNRDKEFLLCIKVMLAVALGYFIKVLINLVDVRPRPFLAHQVNLMIKGPFGGSFPSMHTLIAFVIAIAVYSYNKKIGIYFFIMALLVGVGRIYTGVHYPLDIAGGIFFAWLSIFLIGKINWKEIFKIT